jgi:hypothetical protein
MASLTESWNKYAFFQKRQIKAGSIPAFLIDTIAHKAVFLLYGGTGNRA